MPSMGRRVFITQGLLLLVLTLPAGSVVAEGKTEQTRLVGTWTLVLVDNVLSDGSRVQLYGPEPRGLLVLDDQGRYSLQILREGRARFASNDKSQGTPEEYKAAAQGSNSHFGRYTVDEKAHTVTFHIDHASFPNWEGTEQKRAFILEGDELTYRVPTPTTGKAAVGEVKWKRAR